MAADCSREVLKRELGLLDLLALGINGVIGTGIFFLPGKIASLMGPASVLAFILAGLLSTLLVICFAEVGSRFSTTGGPMVYSQAAFGEVIGFLVGWITWVNRVIAWAALASAMFLATVATFPAAKEHRLLVLGGLYALLTAANIAGVDIGARITNILTALKLIPLVVFVGLGLFFIKAEPFHPFMPFGLRELAPATLIIFYAFTGFESLGIPAGEMKTPRHSLHRALLLTMALVTGIYLAIWAVCTGTLPTIAGADNPVADAARTFLGQGGGRLISLGILLSVVGINAASALVSPRCLYALARDGYLPGLFAWVHPRTKTPIVAILVTAGLALTLALSQTFVQLVVISVLARFAQYVPTCLALPVLRYKDARRRAGLPVEVSVEMSEPTLYAPFGWAIPWLAIVLCVWLLADTNATQLLWGTLAFFSGLIFYLPMRLTRDGG